MTYLRQHKKVVFSLIIVLILISSINHNLNDSFITNLLSLILLIGGGTIMLRFFKKSRHIQPTHENFEATMKPKMLAHYRKSGLSDDEISLFRETMADAKKQITTLEEYFTENPKLRAVNLNHDTLNISKALFANIVKEPQRLNEAGDFLYKHLPKLTEIAHQYRLISTHEVKTKDTYAVMDRSIEVMAMLSESIRRDYTQFVKKDLDRLQDEIDIEHQHLQSEKTVLKMQEQLNKVDADYQVARQKATHHEEEL